MKKILLSLATISLLQSVSAVAADKIVSNFNFVPTAVCSNEKYTFVVKNNQIFQLKKDVLSKVVESNTSFNDAVVYNNQLWAATQSGIQVYDINKGYAQSKHLLENKRVSQLTVDQHNRLWAALPLLGAYMKKDNDSFEVKVNAMGCYSIESTKDSSVWVGTSIGLYKLNESDFKYTRYAEEGHSGHELPDNIVEKLYKDDQSNVWVVMPDNISFKSSKNYSGEIPSYAFVGDKENNIRNIIPLPKSSFLFVTDKSISLLASSELESHNHYQTEEVLTAHNAKAFGLNAEQLSAPNLLRNEPVLYAEKSNSKIYFITSKGAWSVSESAIIKKNTKKTAKHAH